MSGRRLHCRFTAWIALIAVLAAVLAPAAIHAMSELSGGVRWVEVCTPTGVKLVALDGDHAEHRQSSESEDGISAGLCPYCSTHAASIGLPPPSSWRMPEQKGANVLPIPSDPAPRPVSIWAPSRARAPPVQF